MQKSRSKFFVLFSPLIVIILLCGIYALNGIFPFGNKSVAWCDLNQQTIPLLMNLKDILCGNSDLFYSTANGGGMNFWGVFLFFLASPFYLLVAFIEKQDINYFVNFLLILKLALCGFTGSLYLNIRYRRLKKEYVVFFGVVYALCNFGLMYYQTLVWLDTMYMFPLLLLSLDRLCISRKPGLYIIVLSAMVITNYYLSLMTVIYLVISVPLYITIKCPRQNRKAVSLMFILSSIACAMITAPVWLCSLIQVGESARSLNNLEIFMFTPLLYSFKDKLCIIGGTAFLFVTLLPLLGSRLKQKPSLRYNLTVLALLIIPVLTDPVNKIWHGGGYQSFPLRFGYMIVFTLLLISAEVLCSLSDTRKSIPTYTAISFIFAGVLVFASVFVISKQKNKLLSYMSSLNISADFFRIVFGIFLFAFCAYTLFLMLYRKGFISGRIFFVLVCVAFSAEFFMNGSVFIGFPSTENSIIGQTAEIEGLVPENGYYRVKNEKKYTHVNLIGGAGYNSYSHYTSLTPEDYMFAMKKLGYSSYWMEVGSSGGTVMTDALLGNRYSVGTEYDFGSYHTVIAETELFTIAENSFYVPAGIISSIPPQQSEELVLTDRVSVQRQVAEHFFGNDDMIISYEPDYVIDGEYVYTDNRCRISASEPELANCRLMYEIDVKGHEVLYLDLFDRLSNNVTEPIYNSVKVTVNGVIAEESYPNKITNGFLKLGEFEDETVQIILTFLKDVEVSSFGIFGTELDILHNELEMLRTTAPDVSGNRITVSTEAGENEYLYLAVPWNSGFKACNNGRETTLYKVNDSFCAVELSPGQNSIELVFYPEGLGISLLLCLGGIVFAIFIVKSVKISTLKKAGQISLILCKAVFMLILIIIYIIPVIIYLAGVIIRLGA